MKNHIRNTLCALTLAAAPLLMGCEPAKKYHESDVDKMCADFSYVDFYAFRRLEAKDGNDKVVIYDGNSLDSNGEIIDVVEEERTTRDGVPDYVKIVKENGEVTEIKTEAAKWEDFYKRKKDELIAEHAGKLEELVNDGEFRVERKESGIVVFATGKDGKKYCIVDNAGINEDQIQVFEGEADAVQDGFGNLDKITSISLYVDSDDAKIREVVGGVADSADFADTLNKGGDDFEYLDITGGRLVVKKEDRTLVFLDGYSFNEEGRLFRCSEPNNKPDYVAVKKKNGKEIEIKTEARAEPRYGETYRQQRDEILRSKIKEFGRIVLSEREKAGCWYEIFKGRLGVEAFVDNTNYFASDDTLDGKTDIFEVKTVTAGVEGEKPEERVIVYVKNTRNAKVEELTGHLIESLLLDAKLADIAYIDVILRGSNLTKWVGDIPVMRLFKGRLKVNADGSKIVMHDVNPDLIGKDEELKANDMPDYVRTEENDGDVFSTIGEERAEKKYGKFYRRQRDELVKRGIDRCKSVLEGKIEGEVKWQYDGLLLTEKDGTRYGVVTDKPESLMGFVVWRGPEEPNDMIEDKDAILTLLMLYENAAPVSKNVQGWLDDLFKTVEKYKSKEEKQNQVEKIEE